MSGLAGDLARNGVGQAEVERQVTVLEAEVRRLRLALGTAVPVERAVGVLAQRFGVTYDDARALLEDAADQARRDIVALAAEVGPGVAPPAVLDELRSARHGRRG